MRTSFQPFSSKNPRVFFAGSCATNPEDMLTAGAVEVANDQLMEDNPKGMSTVVNFFKKAQPDQVNYRYTNGHTPLMLVMLNPNIAKQTKLKLLPQISPKNINFAERYRGPGPDNGKYLFDCDYIRQNPDLLYGLMKCFIRKRRPDAQSRLVLLNTMSPVVSWQSFKNAVNGKELYPGNDDPAYFIHLFAHYIHARLDTTPEAAQKFDRLLLTVLASPQANSKLYPAIFNALAFSPEARLAVSPQTYSALKSHHQYPWELAQLKKNTSDRGAQRIAQWLEGPKQ